MQPQAASDVGIVDPGARQQGGRVDRAAGDDHDSRPHGEPVRAAVRLADAALDAGRSAPLDADARDVAVGDQPRPRGGGCGESYNFV